MVLHIFLRQTGDRLQKSHPQIRPHWFDYKKCFYNFVNTLHPATFNYDIKFNIIFDGDLTGTFTENYLNNPITPTNLIQINSGGESVAGNIMWRFIKEQYKYDDKDIIYIVENDYIHTPGWVDVLVGLYESFDASYASLYDHNDKYFLPMYDDLQSPIIYTKHCHWRGVPNTTGTFAVKGEWLREDIDQHLAIEGDFHKFKALVETRAASVYTPMPGYSTHCMNDLLSPLVDWEKILNETTK
jgi:glycosyltransferase involved in cell wall biosynthesis